MKKIFLLVTCPMFLMSCAISPGATLTSCSDETNEPSDTDIRYRYEVDGKIEMEIKLKSNSKNKSQFRVRLKPRGNKSDDVLVTTTGVSGTLPDNTSTPFAWLNGSGTYNSTAGDQRSIILCVPDVPPGTWYKFDISVAGIGTIDPRVDVD